MRVAYHALYYQRDKAQETTANIARMTHWYEHSTKTVLLYTDAINAIVNSDWTAGEAKKTAKDRMKEIRKIIPADPVRPTGYSVASLICAMDAIQATDSFENALVA